MRSTTSLLISSLAFGAVALSARAAVADPAFPPEIKTLTGADCEPPCTICHQDALGGFGTVVTPFGKAMQLNGLDFTNPKSVDTALAAMEASADYNFGDTDGDGISDREELMNDTDPNPGGQRYCGAGADAPPTEVYGCGARIAPPRGASVDPLAAALAALSAMALARTARRRS
jgi:hypothetical protein